MKILKGFLALIVVIALGIFVYYKVYLTEKERSEQAENAKQLIQFNLDSMSTFTFVRPDSSITFEQGPGRIWYITSPIETEADRDPLFELFRSLDASNILYTVEESPGDLAPFGLSDPDYYMAMQYTNASPDTLFIGKNTPDGTMTYVTFASEDRVVAVDNDVTDLLKLPINSYRSRTILNVIDSDIKTLEISRFDDHMDTIRLERVNYQWEMTQPWEHPADRTNVETLLASISNETKKRLVEEKTDNFGKYGLDNPTYVLSVSLDYGMGEKILLIGDQSEEPVDHRTWYAKTYDKDLIFTVSNDFIPLLQRSTSWFIDKHPVHFIRNNVTRIVVESYREPITIAQNADGSWSTLEPVDANLRENTVNGLFLIGRLMVINELYTYNPTEHEIVETGLDSPNLVLKFFDNNQELATVEYGDTFVEEHQRTYLRTSQRPHIYITDTSINTYLNELFADVFDM